MIITGGIELYNETPAGFVPLRKEKKSSAFVE
jgi:hypothetical protein